MRKLFLEYSMELAENIFENIIWDPGQQSLQIWLRQINLNEIICQCGQDGRQGCTFVWIDPYGWQFRRTGTVKTPVV